MNKYIIILSLITTSALAAGNADQWKNIDPATREWFRDLKAPGAYVHCCDIADGHRTDWEIRPDGYYVPVPWMPKGKEYWVKVPPETIIYDSGNPTGDAVIWYTTAVDSIRCFVPGGGF